MTTPMTRPLRPNAGPPAEGTPPPPTGAQRPTHEAAGWRRRVEHATGWCAALPTSLVALVGRVAIAGTFWRSGQTKVEGFALDLVEGTAQFGWPHLSASAVDLFRDEYRLPLLPPELAAVMAATGEHVLPALLLLGLATRLSALGLLGMTLVIQLFVYPGAWPTHGVWAAVLLGLIKTGGGAFSLDALWQRSAGGPR